MFYTEMEQATRTGDIWAVSADGSGAKAVVTSPNDDRYGTPSDDNRWLAFVSYESGKFEVYVRALSGTGVGGQVSIDGGSQPQWRPDGRELYYLGPNRTLMSVDFESGLTTVVAGTPKALFATRIKVLEVQGTPRSYAAARDGQRFLVANATEPARGGTVTVELNWPALLPN